MNRKSAAFFLMAMGVLALAFGFYLTFFQTKGYAETTAVIERIEEHGDFDDTSYDVYVRYSVDGREYHGESDFYSAGYREGKEIKIFYIPDNPEQIHGDAGHMGIYLMAIGPVLTLLGVAYLFRKIGY